MWPLTPGADRPRPWQHRVGRRCRRRPTCGAGPWCRRRRRCGRAGRPGWSSGSSSLRGGFLCDGARPASEACCGRLAVVSVPFGSTGSHGRAIVAASRRKTWAGRASARRIRAFGAVHRAIGAAQRVVDAVVGSEDGDADARGGDDVLSLDVRGLTRELALERRGDVTGALAVGVWQEDGELVAAEARDHVARAQPLRDDLADVLEHLIAGVMSKRVIDGLEVVEVEHQHRSPLAIALDPTQLLLQRTLEEPAVVQPGQVIASSEALQLAVEPLSVGDVLHLRHETPSVAVFIASQGHPQLRPYRRAVTAQVALLQLVARDAAAKQFAEELDVGVEVVGMGDLMERPAGQLVGGVAENRAQRRIDVQAAAVQVDEGHADGRVVEGATQLLVRDPAQVCARNLARTVAGGGSDADRAMGVRSRAPRRSGTTSRRAASPRLDRGSPRSPSHSVRAGAHAVSVVAPALPWRSASSAAARMLRAYSRAAVGDRVASATRLTLPRDAAAQATCRAQRFSSNLVSPRCRRMSVRRRRAPPSALPLRRRPPGLSPPPVSEQPGRVAIARLCHVGPAGRGRPHAGAGTSAGVSTKHPAQDERGRFEELAEQASNFTSSPAFFAGCALLVAFWAASFAAGDTAHHVAGDLMAAVTLLLLALLKNAERRAEHAVQQKLDAIAAALLEQREGDETAAQDDLAEAIGLHDEV